MIMQLAAASQKISHTNTCPLSRFSQLVFQFQIILQLATALDCSAVARSCKLLDHDNVFSQASELSLVPVDTEVASPTSCSPSC